MKIEEAKKLFETKRADLSSLSVKIYLSYLNGILKLMKSDNLKILIDKPDEIIKKIEDYYDNANTRKTKIGTILSYIKLLKSSKIITDAKNIYLKSCEKYNGDVKDKLKNHEKNEKEELSIPTKEDFKILETKLKEDTPTKINTFTEYKKFRDYIIFKLYQTLATRLDLADTKILFKDNKDRTDEYNYIYLDKKNKKITYELNNYKTKNVYGKKIIPIDIDYNLMNNYKKCADKFSEDGWLFLNDNSKKMTRTQLGNTFKSLGIKYIGKPITISGNRHKAVNDIIDIEKLEKLANNMGHSVQEQLNVYAKKSG